MLFKQNKVHYIKGTASFVSPNTIPVQLNESGESTVEVKNFIIATGSEATLPWRRHRDGRAADRQLDWCAFAAAGPRKDGRHWQRHHWTGDRQRMELSRY